MTLGFRLIPLLSAVVAAAISGVFYDVFWWPPDDGAYAYVADQMNRGKVLHLHIQDLHPGYVNIVNAWALQWFGDDFVSLRYPLILMTVVAAYVVGYLLLYKGPWISAIGSLAVSGLTFVQFVNPSANWYAFFLAVMLIALLQQVPPGNRYRCLAAGFLLATMFLFRQLSAVFAGMGVLSYLLWEANGGGNQGVAVETQARPPQNVFFARLLVIVMIAGLLWYLAAKSQFSGMILFGLYPIILLFRQFQQTALDNRQTFQLLLPLAAGFAIGLIPAIAYFTFNGALRLWLSDTFTAAAHLTKLPFFDMHSYLDQILESVTGMFAWQPERILNRCFWVVMLVFPAFYGILLIKRTDYAGKAVAPLAYIPVFYMLVSIHYEIPIYLFYSLALVLVATLALMPDRRLVKLCLSGIVIMAVAVGLAFHAGRPLRPLDDILDGKIDIPVTACGLRHCSVMGDAHTIEKVTGLVAIVERFSRPGDAILSVPFNPELYYLTKRSSPLRYYNLAFGLVSESDIENALDAVAQSNTAVLFVNREDKYFTPSVGIFVDRLSRFYDYYTRIDSIEVYLRR